MNLDKFNKIFFLLRHGSVTFPLTSTKYQLFSILQLNCIIFSTSKRPWLMNKFCLLRFVNFQSNDIRFIKFDALTARKIISKQHMKNVSVTFFCSFLKLTKFC